MQRLLPLHTLVFCAVASAGAVLFACAESSESGDPTLAEPTTPRPQITQTPDEGVGAASANTKCERLGALSATSLPAMLDRAANPDTQLTGFTLPNRPVRSKVKVLAVGGPTTLQGKAAVLGADANKSWATCTHCVLVSIGCASDTDCSGAAFFYPRRGTATFNAIATQRGQPYTGSLDDVELEQVTIDPTTLASTPVPNGACMHVSKLAFEAIITTGSVSAVDAGTSGTSGGSTSGASGTSGATSGGSSDDLPWDPGSGKSSTSSGGLQF